MAESIAFVHHKGGTGKTTSCLNVAGWLTKLGKKVLVVDLDPQGNATTGLGIERNSMDCSVYDVFFGRTRVQDVILETLSGIHLAPSSIDLLAAEIHMAGKPGKTLVLKERLLEVDRFYDYILVDVPPGSTMLMINGLVAAENAIVPVDAGVFAYETMETLRILLRDIEKELAVEVNIMQVLIREHPSPSIFKDPTREIRKMVEQFLNAYCSILPRIFSVPFSNKIYEAQKKGVPISHHSPLSNVGQVYKKIAKEVIDYGRSD